jgi:phosphate transport system substrate-binding protein
MNFSLTGKKTSYLPATSQKGLSGKITMSGAYALYPMAVRWGEEFKKINPGVSFDIQGGGAGKGMTDVLAGIRKLRNGISRYYA